VRLLVRLWCEARIAGMKRYRRLRRLVVDAELLRRRAAGEPLRALAHDYGVAHTTLGRYFARPEVARQLREQASVLRAERQAARAERAFGRKREQEVRRRAREQVGLERAQARAAAAARARVARRRGLVAPSPYELFLDERDLARPLTRAELHSQLDEIAASVVASAGGIEAIIEATDLCTRENVLGSIDTAILGRAFDNDDAARAGAEPSRERLRRLRPDPALIQRRAAGEPLRTLGHDYRISHTTLARYFKRPDVAHQLRTAHRLTRAHHTQPAVPAHTPAG
jgi:hypothetical protein